MAVSKCVNILSSLAIHHEDQDGATSKGRGGSQEAKQSLAEYATLYREYEHIEQCIKDGNYDPELERRKEELSKELAAREEHIRRVRTTNCFHTAVCLSIVYPTLMQRQCGGLRGGEHLELILLIFIDCFFCISVSNLVLFTARVR